MNASLQFRLFSSLEAAGDCFHTCACSAIRVAELPSDAGPINWGGWYPLSADIQTLTAALSPDAILLVQGKRGDKPCRIRPPFGAIVVAPTNSLVTKTTTAGTTTTYQGQVVALAGTVVDDESKLILDEEEPEVAPVAAPAPVVQAAPAAQSPIPAPAAQSTATAEQAAPDAAALREAAAATAAASTRGRGRPKGSPNKAHQATPDDTAAAPAADTVRAIAQIQADLDSNRQTIEKLNADAAAAAASAAAISQQIANALKGQAGLLGELEAATNAQRAAADRARAALGALL